MPNTWQHRDVVPSCVEVISTVSLSLALSAAAAAARVQGRPPRSPAAPGPLRFLTARPGRLPDGSGALARGWVETPRSLCPQQRGCPEDGAHAARPARTGTRTACVRGLTRSPGRHPGFGNRAALRCAGPRRPTSCSPRLTARPGPESPGARPCGSPVSPAAPSPLRTEGDAREVGCLPRLFGGKAGAASVSPSLRWRRGPARGALPRRGRGRGRGRRREEPGAVLVACRGAAPGGPRAGGGH